LSLIHRHIREREEVGKMKKLIAILMAVGLLIPLSAGAKRTKYRVIEVTNGGIIKGVVRATKKVPDPVLPIEVKPKPDPKETAIEKETCGSSQPAGMYVFSPDLGVKNVLVIVEGIKEGKAAPRKDIVINNRKCRFEPLVGITYVKSKFIIKNSDPIFHNTSLGKLLKNNRRRVVYNLALPRQGQVIKKPVRVPGLIDVKCDAHPWMRAYIYASRHPYVAITDGNGRFEIRDLPPGKYRVRFWHEGFEEVVKEIEVKAGGSTEVSVTFTKTRKPAFLKGLGL